MKPRSLISVDEFCKNHDVEISFISSLHQIGLIEIAEINEIGFIEVGQLRQLEKILRLHYDLEINVEGIETITYLLRRIQKLQEENNALQNRLRLYEHFDE